jgi:PleD family two-component response regulator
VDTLLERADQALYQAKAAGRNSVVRYSDTLALRPPRA